MLKQDVVVLACNPSAWEVERQELKVSQGATVSWTPASYIVLHEVLHEE